MRVVRGDRSEGGGVSGQDGAIVALFRKQIEPDKQPVRAAQEVAGDTKDQTYYLRPDGKGAPGETRNWDQDNEGQLTNAQTTNLPFNAMSFVVGGQRYTAVYIDHPENPKPARYSERDYGRFGSYFVHDLEPGSPLDVQYRIWLQEGEMTLDDVRRIPRRLAHARPPQHRGGSP